MPFISVVVPVYNVKDYIKRCVDSLLNQKYNDYEIILVDDGSTDGSGELCDLIAKKNLNVMAVHKKNGGLASARNYGLDYVKGKYVTFVDSDDWVTDDYFAFIDEHLRKYNSEIFKFGYQRVQNGELRSITIPYFKEGKYDRKRIESDILPGTVGPICLFDYSRSALMSACVCAYSVEFLNSNGIRFQSEREILSEDHLFNYKVLLRAKSAGISHKILYMYDFREGSLTKRYISNMVERKQNLLRAYKEELEKSNLFKKYEDIYYSQCVDGYYACITNECSQWGELEGEKDTERVANILNLPECCIAIKKCKKNNIKFKGRIIYWLMKNRQAKLICFLYKKVKNNGM